MASEKRMPVANEGLGWDHFRFFLVGYFLQDMNSRLTEVQEEKRELQAWTGGTGGGGYVTMFFG